ncbi:MAG: CoA-binding protein [Bacteroidales bacterium]|nr:CoA-binding protein [Bacteroidales bacterium]
MGKYLVLGASPNPLRHSNKVIKSLVRHNKMVVPVGFRSGTVSGIEIKTGFPPEENTENLLLYVGSRRQKDYYDYILKLHPKKIVFNPGTENPELMELAQKHNIECIEGCALVMINGGQL